MEPTAIIVPAVSAEEAPLRPQPAVLELLAEEHIVPIRISEPAGRAVVSGCNASYTCCNNRSWVNSVKCTSEYTVRTSVHVSCPIGSDMVYTPTKRKRTSRDVLNRLRQLEEAVFQNSTHNDSSIYASRPRTGHPPLSSMKPSQSSSSTARLTKTLKTLKTSLHSAFIFYRPRNLIRKQTPPTYST